MTASSYLRRLIRRELMDQGFLDRDGKKEPRSR
jgi:hypothetical protein